MRLGWPAALKAIQPGRTRYFGFPTTLARITQQELADGIGTMREVAARALRDLRSERIVATTPGCIEILDARRLAASLGAWQTATSQGGWDDRWGRATP